MGLIEYYRAIYEVPRPQVAPTEQKQLDGFFDELGDLVNRAERTYWFGRMPSDPQGQQEFEQKPYRIYCTVCGSMGEGSEAQLLKQDWTLTPEGEFCYRH